MGPDHEFLDSTVSRDKDSTGMPLLEAPGVAPDFGQPGITSTVPAVILVSEWAFFVKILVITFIALDRVERA